jgi:CubicO group peptidase (beta-lactamase class C family)
MACSSGSGTPRDSNTTSLDLHAMVDAVRTDTAVPGIAAAIARTEGPPTIAVAGVRDIESGAAIQQADVFETGSVTKSVTATALAVLVDEGRLTWSTRVFDALGSAGVRQEYRDVSLSLLMRHRAAIARLQSPDPEMERAIDRLRGTPAEQRAMLVDWMLTRAPAFAPGASYE